METITNEEQKNYIEMLRQTLENSILKNGINDLLNAQKLNYPRDTSSLDILVDVTLIRAECEKFRKDLLKSQLTNEQYSDEVEDLKKKVEDFELKNAKLNEEIENLQLKLDEKENIIFSGKEENETILEELEKWKKNHEKLSKDISVLFAKNNELEKDYSEVNRSLIGVQGGKENLNVVKTKFNELKKTSEKQKDEYETLLQEKYELVTEKSKLNDDLLTLGAEIKNLEEKNNAMNEEFQSDKNALTFDNEKLHRKTKLLEKEIVDYKNMVDSKSKEIHKLQESNNSRQQTITDNMKQIEDLRNNFDKEKKILNNEIYQKEIEIETCEAKNEEYMRNLVKLNLDIEEFERDEIALENIINNKNKEISELEGLNREAETENFKLKENISRNDIDIKNLNQKVQEQSFNIQTLDENLNVMENKNEILNDKLIKLSDENDNLIKQKNNLIEEKERVRLELINQINSFNKEVNDTKSRVNSTISNERFESHKFHNMIKNDQFKIFSQKFKDKMLDHNMSKKEPLKVPPTDHRSKINISTISNISNNISNTNISPDKATQNNSPNHRSKINMINEVKNVSPVPGNEEDLLSLLARVDDYQKIISSEIENLFNRTYNTELENKDLVNQIERKNNEFEDMIERMRSVEERERVLNNQLKNSKEDNSNLKNEIETLNQKINKTYEDNFLLKNEIEKIYEEKDKVLKEGQALQQLNNDLILELRDKNSDICLLNHQLDAFEERLKIMIKERKSLKDLISKLINTGVYHEQMELANDLLGLNEQFFEMEREKLKVEQSINKNRNEDRENNNRDLTRETLLDRDNLISIERQMNDNLGVQRITENKMKENHDNINRKLNPQLDNELKIKQLTHEINNYKEQIKTLSGNLVTVPRGMPEKSLKSNTKSNPNMNFNYSSNSKFYTMTDYENQEPRPSSRIEREFKDKVSEKEKQTNTSRFNDNTNQGLGMNNRNSESAKQLLIIKKEDDYTKILRYNNSFLKKKEIEDSISKNNYYSTENNDRDRDYYSTSIRKGI